MKDPEIAITEEDILTVLSEGTSEDVYHMAGRIQDNTHSLPVHSVLTKLENRLLEVGTCEYLFKFARKIYQANTQSLQEALIRKAKTDSVLGDSYLNEYNCAMAFLFALEIRGADIDALAEIPVLLENEEYSKKFLGLLDIAESDSVAVLSSALKSRRPH